MRQLSLLGKPKKASYKRPKDENPVNKACLRMLSVFGCFVWRNNTGGWRLPSGRVIRYGKPGSGDILGMTPNGRFIAVECKDSDKDIDEEQDEFRQMVLKHNGIYILARYSAQAVMDAKDLILTETW